MSTRDEVRELLHVPNMKQTCRIECEMEEPVGRDYALMQIIERQQKEIEELKVYKEKWEQLLQAAYDAYKAATDSFTVKGDVCDVFVEEKDEQIKPFEGKNPLVMSNEAVQKELCTALGMKCE